MQELPDKVAAIANLTDHYLVKAKELDHPYFAGFLAAGAALKQILSAPEFAYWCAEKMLLKQQLFNEKTFIQYAVETTVARYFAERFPVGFQVEAKINPDNDKDVDCVFQDSGFTFNVEVKCSDFKAKEKVDQQDAFKFVTVGRLPDRGEEAKAIIMAALAEGLAKQGKPQKPFIDGKNMDNNLKGFLEQAHEKFPATTPDTTVNVLLVGCDDAEDMQNWFNYLWASEGLFTQHSFADRAEYENVDLVVLTNQYFKHNRFFEKDVSASWELGQGFNLIFQNPFRRKHKAQAISHFLNLFPNQTVEFDKFVPTGNVPAEVKNARRVAHFVKEYMEDQRGRYLLFLNKQDEPAPAE